MKKNNNNYKVMQKKIVFFGSGYYTIPIVEVLKDQGLIFVVTTENEGKFKSASSQASLKDVSSQASLIDYLKSRGIPFFYSRLKNSEDVNRIQNLKPDLGVLASYGAIIPKEIIEIFPLGILNIHPSLLPKYKGPSPIQFTILDGNTTTGVSVIKLDDQVDHGPIIKQEKIELKGNETLKKLTELLFLEGSKLINGIVQKINQGLEIKSNPQRINNEKVTGKIKKTDGQIDFNNPPKYEDLKRKIRAFYPWPGVYLTISLGGKNRILKLMPNDTVQVEGKRPMSYKDFVNGYGNEAESILSTLGLI
jgi:methionyl-tRNA formyltransferase